MKLLIVALSFFTRIPVKTKSIIDSDIFFKSMLLLPIIGLIIGGILYLLSFIVKCLDYLPLEALILTLIYFLITGGLHYDGVSDSIDALFSNKNQKDILLIMKDPYIGTFGSLTLILMVLSFYICNLFIITKQIYWLLFFFPIVGRLGAIELGAFFSPNNKSKGLGYNFCKVDKPVYFWIYFLFILVIFILFNTLYLISFIIVILSTVLIGSYISKKANGITGDFLGLIIEIDQIIFLLSFIIIKSSLKIG